MKTKKILTGYLVFSILAGIGLAVWRTVLLYRYFDPYNNEFTYAANAPLKTLGYVMLIALLLVCSSAIFLQKKTYSPFTASRNAYSVFASSLTGCLFAAAGILALIYYSDALFASNGTAAFRLLLLIALITLFLSAVYFIISASSRYAGTSIKKVFALFPMIFATAYLGAAYLSPDFVFSDSNDLLRNVSLAALVLFFIQESRACFYQVSDVFRFPFAVAALVCLITYELPNLFVTAFWEMELTYMTMFELVECGVIFYIIACARNMISHIELPEPQQETVS